MTLTLIFFGFLEFWTLIKDFLFLFCSLQTKGGTANHDCAWLSPSGQCHHDAVSTEPTIAPTTSPTTTTAATSTAAAVIIVVFLVHILQRAQRGKSTEKASTGVHRSTTAYIAGDI